MVTPEELSAAKRALSLINLFKPWALAFVAVGVAYEFIADRLEKPYNRTIDLSHDEDLARLKESTALAQERAALLRSVVMPLDLSEKEQSDIGAASKHYAGRSVLVSSNPTDIEGRILAPLIIEALRRGGVKAVATPQLGVTWGGLGSGVTIFGPDRQFAESLRNILDKIGG